MANIVYCRPLDIKVPPTIAASAEDAAYPKAGLFDLDSLTPAQLTTTSGNWVFDYGSAQSLDIWAIINHNLSAGLEVRIQANATDSWGAPSLNQLIVIPTYQDDGHPVNPWLDLSAVSPRSFRFWRLVVVGVNASAIKIGELLPIETKRSLDVNISWGASDGEEHPVVEHRTDYARLAFDLGTKWRTLEGETDTTDAGHASALALFRGSRGVVRQFLLIPDPAINDAMFVRAKEPRYRRTQTFLDRNLVPFAVEEVGRGLPL